MNQGFVESSGQGITPVRRPYPAFVPLDKVEETVLAMLATLTSDGKDVGYPQIRDWRGEAWFKDLVAACAKTWACNAHVDLRQSAFHRPQAPRTNDGLPIYGRDGNVRWRLWPVAPLLRTDEPDDRLPFCTVQDLQGKAPPYFRSRLLHFIGNAGPDLFLDAGRALAAARAAFAAIPVAGQPWPEETVRAAAETWQGLDAAPTVEDPPKMLRFEEIRVRPTPPVAVRRPTGPILPRPASYDFGVVLTPDWSCDLEATTRFQEAAAKAASDPRLI